MATLSLMACGTGQRTSDDPDAQTPGQTHSSGGGDARPNVVVEKCTNGIDDDEDELVDCADPDCEEAACGPAGHSCHAGGCVDPKAFPSAPPIVQLKTDVRGDSVIVSFEPVEGAKDYRIYEYPADPSMMFRDGDYLGVTGGTYRCAGDRPLSPLVRDEAVVAADVKSYRRTEADAVIGHVYVTPGPNRVPVYVLGDPAPQADWGWRGPMYGATRTKMYTTSAELRTELLGQGWRDDGIAFYTVASESGETEKVYRYTSKATDPRRWVLLATAAVERQKRKGDKDLTEEALFDVLRAPAAGTVPLYRVLLSGADWHDELAAGKPRYDRIRLQGNQPSWELQWSGMSGPTKLVVEALDAGCPHQGILSPVSSPASSGSEFANLPPYVTPEEVRARSPHGEVFVNGQFAKDNRPKVLARGFVEVAPKPPPKMDWFLGFGPGEFEETFETNNLRNGMFELESPSFVIDWWASANEKVFGSLFGQFWVNFNEVNGSNGKFRLAPKKLPEIGANDYLHVTMEATAASTARRYPQILISSEPPPAQKAMVNGNTVILQTITNNLNLQFATELQLQFCDHRTWDVNNQCPKATLARSPDWSPATAEDAAWWPAPVVGEYASHDRMAKFDIYMTNRKAYVFFENKPFGCAVLPKDLTPAGSPVSVTFATVLYHSGADAEVLDFPDQGYLKRFSEAQTQRHFDNLGFSAHQPAPKWDETKMPCATKFFD